MKMKHWIGIAIVVALLAYSYVFYSRKSDALELETDVLLGCINPPMLFKKWNNFAATDWGSYAKSIEKYLGIRIEDKQGRAYVEGFFKAINVEPRSAYVRYYQKDLQKWLKSPKSLPHWDIEIGVLNCKS